MEIFITRERNKGPHKFAGKNLCEIAEGKRAFDKS